MFQWQSLGVRPEELAVRVDGAREGLREPVEGDAVEDGGEGEGRVGPFEEFFGDPINRVSGVGVGMERRGW